MPTPVVEPVNPNASVAPPVEAAPGAEPMLPDDLLQIPALQALMAGQPPAVSTPIKGFSNRPEAQIIAQNKDQLTSAGIGFYRALDGQTGVLFNQLYVRPEDIQAADKAGQLASIAPPFDDVNAAVLQAGPDNPVLSAAAVPAGPASVAPQPPQMGSPIPPTSGLSGPAEKKLTSERLKNLAIGPPSSGARPGGGRLLNAILNRPV